MVGGKLVDQLGGIEGMGDKLQVALDRQEAADGLGAGDGIYVPPPGQRDLAVGPAADV